MARRTLGRYKQASFGSFALFVTLSIASTMLSAILVSGLLESSFNLELAGEFLLVYALPIVGGVLARSFGVLQGVPLWLWYIIALGWVAMTFQYIRVLQYVTGNMTQSDIADIFARLIPTFLWTFVAAVVAFAVATARGYPLDKAVGFYFTAQNPFYLPIAVLSDASAFTFAAPVWVAIVVMWAIWAKVVV